MAISPPKATLREKKICVAASSHTWGFVSFENCNKKFGDDEEMDE